MAEKASIWKFLPIIIGVALGLLIVNPPDWLRVAGIFAYLITAVVAFGVLVGFIILLINKNLPAELILTPENQPGILVDLMGLASELERLGFVRATPTPLRVEIAPPALLVPFVNEKERIYATIFKTGTIPAKISYDMISIVDGWRGGLTTGPNPQGASFPAPPGSLKQVFPGAAFPTLFEKHREALSYLKGKGLPAKAIRGDSFEVDFKKSFAGSRLHFLSSPVSFALITLWRSSTNKNPHLGPIQTQAIAQQTIEKILTGHTALP